MTAANNIDDAIKHHNKFGDMDGKTCLLNQCALHYPDTAAPETAAERDQLREVNAELLAALELCLVYAGHGLMDNIYGKQVKLDQIWAVAHAAIEKAKGK